MTNRVSDPRPVCADCGRTLQLQEFLQLTSLRSARCRSCVAVQTHKPRWASAVPAQSGWYKWRRDAKSGFECVKIDVERARAWRCGDPTVYRLDVRYGEPAIRGEWWPEMIRER
jgi:hypothetical protein